MQPSPKSDPEPLLEEAAKVRALARHLLRDRDAAEDLAQDVALAAVESGPVPGAPKRMAWLAGVTRRLAARALRDRSRRQRREREAVDRRGGGDTHDIEARLKAQRAVAKAVLELPEPYRTAVVRRYFDGWSPRRIARAEGLGDGAVRQRLHRGLSMLRARLAADLGAEHGEWRKALVLVAGLRTKVVLGAAVWSTGMVMSKVKLAAGILIVAGAAAWGLTRSRVTTDLPVEQVGTTAASERESSLGSDTANLAREPVHRTSASALAQIEVVDPRGVSIAGARVRAWRGTEVLETVVTDATGVAQLDGGGTLDGLVVKVSGRPARVVRDSLQFPMRLVLDDGTVLGGSVLVDGRVAPAGIEFHATVAEFDRELAGVPEALRDALADDREAKARTDALGGFRIDGLPKDWSGELSVDPGLWFSAEFGWPCGPGGAGPDAVALTEARADLIVPLFRVPMLQGRVIDESTGAPIACTGMEVQATFSDDSATPGIGIRTDRDGRFKMALESQSRKQSDAWRRGAAAKLRVRWCAVEIWAPDLPVFRVERSGGEIAEDGDLGTLVMPHAETREVLVLDGVGRPVTRAVVMHTKRMGARTDEEGRTVLVDHVDREPLSVGAEGFGVHRVEPRVWTAGTHADPWVVVIDRRGRLVVGLAGDATADPEVLQSLRMRVASRGPLFEPGGHLWTQVHSALNPAWQSGGGSPAKAELLLTLQDVRTVFEGLARGVEVEISVTDALLHVVARSAVRTPRDDRDVEVGIDVPGEAWYLTGTVAAPDGAAVEGASVQAHLASLTSGSEATTDKNGVFRIGPVLGSLAEPLQLTAQHPGFARTAIEVPPGERLPCRITLQRGREVVVDVVDERGHSQDVKSVGVDGEGAASLSVAPGRFAFRDLPGGSVTFRTWVGGTEHSLEHDTSIPTARLIVPPIGHLTIRVPDELLPEKRFPKVDLHFADGSTMDATALRHDAKAFRSTGVLVVPAGRVQATMELQGAGTVTLGLTDVAPGGEVVIEGTSRTVRRDG